MLVVATLAVVGVGSFIGLQWLKTDVKYEVGSCVLRESDGTAALTDCSTTDAFRIVSSVSSQTECQDARQAYLEVPEGAGNVSYRCLEPAAGAPPTDQPVEPTATGTAA